MKQKRLSFCWFSMIVVLLIFNLSFAQKTSRNTQFELIPDETESSIVLNNMRINEFSGVPIALYKPDYPVNADTPEKMARQYLEANHELFKLPEDMSDIKYFKTNETPGGYHVHFLQYKGDYPVLNSTLNITISRNNRVVFVMNGSKIQYGAKEEPDLTTINVSTEQAILIAKNYLGLTGGISLEKCETAVYYNKGTFRLVQAATIIPSEKLIGQWEVLVDAQTGEIFRVEDKACYSKPLEENSVLVD